MNSEFEHGMEEALRKFKEICDKCVTVGDLDEAYRWLYKEAYSAGQRENVDLGELARQMHREYAMAKYSVIEF